MKIACQDKCDTITILFSDSFKFNHLQGAKKVLTINFNVCIIGIMKKLKLNSKKVKLELIRIGKTQSWLAKQMKCSRQNVWEMLRNGSARSAERIGHALGIEPKDLII